MKKNTAYTIGSLVILLICAFCFVILPAMTGAGQANAKSPVFGKYDGKAITMDEGSPMQSFAANYANMLEAYGQSMDEQTYFYIMNTAFNSTVAKYAYEDLVKDSGYVVSSTAVKHKMIPYFLDENGKYSSKIYKQTPNNVKENLRDSVEDSLYTSRFYDDNFGSESDIVGLHSLYGLKTSDAEIRFMLDLNKEKRGFNMAIYEAKDYPEAEIVNYAKANLDKFTSYDLSIITVNDESTAKTVSRRLANNEITFEDAVAEYSTKSYGDSEGKITGLYSYQLDNMLEEEGAADNIKGLTLNTVSSVLKTGANSFSIFRNDAAPKAAVLTDDSLISSVRSYLITYESSMIEDYFIAKANNLINEANKTDFATACANQEVENITIAPFPLNYGNKEIASTLDTSNSALTNADKNENFLKTAFSLKMNEYSKPFVLNGNVVVLQYTTLETTQEGDTPVFKAEAALNYDQMAASNCVLHSDKLENNFAEVYFSKIMR